MKKIASTLFVGLLALMFVTCVYANGKDAKFSLKKWIENLDAIGELGGVGEKLADAWTKDHRIVDGKEVPWSDKESEEGEYGFFESIRVFFLRLGYTIKTLAEAFLDLLKCVFALLPWNSTIPRGDPYV